MIIKKLKSLFPSFLQSILHSYTQIFFSNNFIFGIILILVSFFDYVAGISGMVSVIMANSAAYLIGFNRFNIKTGAYGFNSLLVGLGLGIYYQFTWEFFILLVFSTIFTLFLTILFEGIIGKYGLPYLSIPFIFIIWAVTIAAREFTALNISERGVYMLNDLYDIGGQRLVNIYYWFSELKLADPIIIYFRSLGAIFFQYHLVAGVLIAIGLIIYSRIAFVLSLVGFTAAYLFYQIIGGDIHQLSYSYIGFNFILSSIAIGGFYFIPSKYSYLWIILITPLISFIISSSTKILFLFQLSIFSLPFNLVTLLFIYSFKFRERFHNKPEFVGVQLYSPEKNLYSQVNSKIRFHNFQYVPVSLPFWGEWTVTQAHHGEHTHQRDWAHAWDFEIADEKQIFHKGSGHQCEDYFCYSKPVIAAGDGVVEEIQDAIDDNVIGEVNLVNNWGNTIVIKHKEGLYSKVSHIKKNSFKVKKGDTVKKGDIIAACGNSGRSPRPHLHFQLQGTPYIGSKTLDYPIGHYILKSGDQYTFKSYDRPIKGQSISNIASDTSLHDAFNFIPGQRFKITSNYNSGKKTEDVWEVKVNLYNQQYIYSNNDKSRAYFKNDGRIHYFTFYEGKKNSSLFYFYLSAYKVITGLYKGIVIEDNFPVNTIRHNLITPLQDIVAPFVLFIKSKYEMRYSIVQSNVSDRPVYLNSSIYTGVIGMKIRSMTFKLKISSGRICSLNFTDKSKTGEITFESMDYI